jgi:hypothetical protein
MFGIGRKPAPVNAMGISVADAAFRKLLSPEPIDTSLRDQVTGSGVDATRLNFELAAFDLFVVTLALEHARRQRIIRGTELHEIAEAFSKRYYENLRRDLPLDVRMSLRRLECEAFDPFAALDWLDTADPELTSLYAALNKRADGYLRAGGDLKRILQTFLLFCGPTSQPDVLGRLAALHFDVYGASYLKVLKSFPQT